MASAGEALYTGDQLKRLTSPKNQAIIGGLKPIGSGSGPGVLPRIEEPPGFAFLGLKSQWCSQACEYSVLQQSRYRSSRLLSRLLSVD
jgi:hypothetical protein